MEGALSNRLPAHWPDELRIGGGSPLSLGCDSLDTLSLGAAVNELFHLYEAGHETDLLGLATFGAWVDHVQTALAGGLSRVTFTTSGSTGRPKRCSHDWLFLATEIRFLAETLADRRRVVALVPAHHIYGFLFTALLPDSLAVDVLSFDRAGLADLKRHLRGGDLVVSFPDRWAWLERSLPAWPPGIIGVTSTAPCPEPLIRDLLGRGLGQMIEVYGSSETAGVGLRTAPGDPYRLMPQWRFAEPFDALAPTLIHSSGLKAPLPDRTAWRQADLFQLAGRRDGAVQVGGVNVHPARIAGRLNERPGVRAAAVRLMRVEEGSRLKAFIVPEPGVDADQLRDALNEWADQALTSAERPKAFTFGADLPRAMMGKATDW